jgi:hypothetical protein
MALYSITSRGGLGQGKADMTFTLDEAEGRGGYAPPVTRQVAVGYAPPSRGKSFVDAGRQQGYGQPGANPSRESQVWDYIQRGSSEARQWAGLFVSQDTASHQIEDRAAPTASQGALPWYFPGGQGGPGGNGNGNGNGNGASYLGMPIWVWVVGAVGATALIGGMFYGGRPAGG